MRVARDILHNRKLVKLELVSGNPAAIKWLIALWGYCETKRAWRFPGMTADNLADACEAIIEGNQLLTFLIGCRFVQMDEKVLVVRNFEVHNRGLIQRWDAAENSRIARSTSGQRPSNARPATVKRPLERARARIDGLIDRESQSAVGTSLGTGKKPSLVLVDELPPSDPVQAQRARVLAAHYDLNGPIASNEERRATMAKFGSLTKSLADKLKTGEN